MATVVCQGLQPYIKSHLVEATTMRLKLIPPKSWGLNRGPQMLDSDIANETRERAQKDDLGGGWGFLQSFSCKTPARESEPSYVHPFSPLKMSERSLELCTESLGSETGSDTGVVFLSSPFDSQRPEAPESVRKEKTGFLPQPESKKAVCRNFPPPLTTISGSSSIQVKPRREGGRLIIQATENSSKINVFQEERSHGRLRLSLWKNVNQSDAQTTMNGSEEKKGEPGEDDEGGVEDEEVCNEENGGFVAKGDTDGNSADGGAEMGMENKFQRPSRCKEDGHGDKALCKWEPLWVATS